MLKDKQRGAISKHTLSYASWSLAIILLLVWVVLQWVAPKYLPIRHVQIQGSYQTATQDELQALLMPLVTGSYFTVNVKTIAKTLGDLPWVANVSVKRVWPDTLVVNLTEQQAYVRWNDTMLVNFEGEEYTPYEGEISQHLAKLRGPQSKLSKVLTYYQQFSEVLSTHNLSIAELELTGQSFWLLRLNNGIAMNIGDENALNRLEQFIRLYPEMFEQHVSDIDYVDMRYTNGLAVRWKPDKGVETY